MTELVRRLPDRFHLGLLLAAAFGMDLAFRAGAQAYQETGISFDGTPLQLGLLGTISAACYSSVCLLSGRISDRVGRRAATLIALAGLATAYLLAGRITRIGQLMALPVLSGSSLAFFWPPVQAWVADLSGQDPRRLARRLGLFNVSWSAGLTVGPAYTGYLWALVAAGSGNSQRVVLWSAAGFCALLAVVMAVVRTRPVAPGGEASPEVPPAPPHPRAGALLFGARVGTFASWFAVGAIGSLFPKFAAELGFDARIRGVLVGAYNAGQLALFIVAIFARRWRFRRWPLVAAEACALVGMLGVFWARAPIHFALAFVIAGICSGVAYTSSLFHSLHGRVADRGP